VGERLEVWEKTRFDAYTDGETYEVHAKVKTLKKAAKDLNL